MSTRFTNTKKWDDGWFLGLSTHAKLAFWYLTEKCNNVGVYEIHMATFCSNLGITKDELERSIPEINSKYITSNNKKHLWLKNFLEHQKNLPLKVTVRPHQQIIKQLHEYLIDPNLFQGCLEMYRLLPEEIIGNFKYKTQDGNSYLTLDMLLDKNPFDAFISNINNTQIKEFNAVKNKPKRKYNKQSQTGKETQASSLKDVPLTPRKYFEPPTVEELETFMRENDLLPSDMCKPQAEAFIDFYSSKGWRVGNAGMKDWKAASRNWARTNISRGNNEISKKTSRSSSIEIIKQSNDNLSNVDWNDLKDKTN